MAGENGREMGKGDAAAAQRKRQAWRTTLLLGLIVLGVLAAYMAGQAIRACLESAHPRDLGQPFRPGPATRPEWVPEDLADILAAPYAVAGLRELSGDPAGVPPPPGSRRTWGYERQLTDQVEQQAWYDAPGPADEAAEHYRREFAGKGYRLLRDDRGQGGQRAMVFSDGQGHALVRLPENFGPTGGVIIVTVGRPALPRRPDKR